MLTVLKGKSCVSLCSSFLFFLLPDGNFVLSQIILISTISTVLQTKAFYSLELQRKLLHVFQSGFCYNSEINVKQVFSVMDVLGTFVCTINL